MSWHFLFQKNQNLYCATSCNPIPTWTNCRNWTLLLGSLWPCLARVLHSGALRTRASLMLGRSSTTEPCPQHLPVFYLLKWSILKLSRLGWNTCHRPRTPLTCDLPASASVNAFPVSTSRGYEDMRPEFPSFTLGNTQRGADGQTWAQTHLVVTVHPELSEDSIWISF